MALRIWLGLYPTITIVLALIGPFVIGRFPLPVVTLIITGIVVPLMVYAIMPLMQRMHGRRNDER